MADVEAGTPRTYDISGTAGHSHTVSLSAADFSVLETTGSLIVTASTAEGHDHMVTIRGSCRSAMRRRSVLQREQSVRIGNLLRWFLHRDDCCRAVLLGQ
jgi:hypothetical protein